MAQTSFIFEGGTAIIKNLGTLILLLLLLPFNLLAVLLTAIKGLFARRPDLTGVTEKKSILITGAKMTKALQLARSFHRDGHNVYLVETHKYWLSGHRFSRAVKGFFTVPVPEKEPEAYCQALVAIAQQKQIDLFIPVSSKCCIVS
ncbi:MAG: ATP-grasp enzyme, partial [Cyanobacteria bacterium J06648_1]